MKKSYITILILSIINSIVLTGIIIVLIIGNHKPIDSTEIFKNNIDSVVEVKASTSDIGESSADHIFRDAEGHLKDDTPENRKKLEGVANDNNNFLGTDQYGNDWYAKDNSDGTQTWVEVRGNKIRNGGVNLTPKPWNPLTGLSGQN